MLLTLIQHSCLDNKICRYMIEHSIYYLFYHQKHYICTFSENCSPTLNVFKVLLTYNLTVTEHKTWLTKTQSYTVVTITEIMTTRQTYK